MKYRLPLATRLRRAASARARYWRNPDEQLRQINKTRKRLGLPPRESLADAATQGPRS